MTRTRTMADRRHSEERHKKRQKWISSICGWFHGYFPVGHDGYWTDEEDEILYYKRYDSPHNRTKFLKRQSNKAIRKMDVEKDEALKGGDYKKVYDYQWELH